MRSKKGRKTLKILEPNIVLTLFILSLFSIVVFFSYPVSACRYSVGTFESDYSTSKTSFCVGDTVFGKGTADVYRLLKLRIKDPEDNIVHYSNESYYVVNCSYKLNDSALTGNWKIQLGIYKCGWMWSTLYNRIACFSVYDTNFTLTIDINGSGIVTRDPEKESYKCGDIVNLTAISDSGWCFSHWTGDILGSDNNVDILMDGDKTVTAHFIQNKYNLNISILGSGNITKDPDQSYYLYGSVVNLTAIPDSDYVFYHWTGDLSGNSNPVIITVNDNKNITAVFIKSFYTITVNVDPIGSGVVEIDPPEPYYNGDLVNLTAIPNSGRFFDHWSGDLIGSSNPTTIVMDGNKTVTAHFIVENYNLSINITGNGCVIKDPDQENYTYATLVNLSAVADSDWMFDHWSGDLTGNDNPVKINMTDNKNITAHFIMSENNGGNGGDNGGEIPNGGNQGPRSAGIKTNKPPIANAGGPYFGIVDEKITFNASLSYDPDYYISSWHWDFGDGTLGEGEIINHSYSTAGNYSVILTVTDTKGAFSNDTADVFISEPNQPPSNLKIIGTTEGIKNIEYLYFIVSIDNDNDTIKYSIDWDDGNTTESNYITSGKYFYDTHKWSEIGNYKLIVTADDNESISTIELEITINEPENPDIPEETNIALIILLIFAFIILLLLLLYANKRRKKDQEKNNNQK